jgi:hypothetical protein
MPGNGAVLDPRRPFPNGDGVEVWQKLSLMNVAFLLGIASSIFVVPASTPFFILLAASAVVLVTLNVAMFRRLRKTTSGAKPATSKTWNVIIAICVAFWILDVLVHIFGR